MKLIKKVNILIVGLGLLGGSYAKGLKKLGFEVNAITKDKSSVDYAVENGIIDYGTTEIEPEIIEKADLVVFALYPHILEGKYCDCLIEEINNILKVAQF